MSHEPPLCVRRFDAPGRYLVRSARRSKPGEAPTWYCCDFTDDEFPHGRCECDDWNIRIESKMRRHEEPPRNDCKHLRRVRSELEHVAALCEQLGIGPNPLMIPEL